jgi:hypothetical protein
MDGSEGKGGIWYAVRGRSGGEAMLYETIKRDCDGGT